MAENKNPSERAREYQLSEVARLYLQGKYQSEIAIALEVSQQQISYDLRSLQTRWKASALRNFDKLKQEHLAKIDQIEREAWAAWERSKDVKETQFTEKVDNVQGELPMPSIKPESDYEAMTTFTSKKPPQIKTKSYIKREGQVGNPAFLEQVQKCVEQRCRIFGFEAPRRTELSGPDGKPLNITATVAVDSRQLIMHLRERLDKATPEERAALIANYEDLEKTLGKLTPMLGMGADTEDQDDTEKEA